MTQFTTVKYEVEDSVAIIRLNRPDSRNSLNHAMRMELRQAISQANNADEVKTVVLAGEGKGFCAGADISDFSDTKPEISEPGFVTHMIRTEYNPITSAIAESQKPFICAVQGAAAGIGASFALACDLMVMSEDAFIYSPFGAIGLVPDGGMHWQLQQYLGAKKAYEFIVESQKLTAVQCLELGIANRVVSGDELYSHTVEWAKSLSHRAPLVLQHSKRMLQEVTAMSLMQCMDREAQVQDAPFQSEDFREGVRAFKEKRRPVFKGI